MAYEPNSLNGGCPLQAGAAGFVSFPAPLQEDKVRGKPEKFAEHYTQATLFFESQSTAEKEHIVAAFRFELSKVNVAEIRERMVSSLVNVSVELAGGVAQGLGMELPAAMPRATDSVPQPEVTHSPALSLLALSGECGIRTRQIAILIADGVHKKSLDVLSTALRKEGAVVQWVGPRMGPFVADDGSTMQAGRSMENAPSVLFDALVLPEGSTAVQTLAQCELTQQYIQDPFKHGKPILVLGESSMLFERAGIPQSSGNVAGILWAQASQAAQVAPAFIQAIAAHRHTGRTSDQALA